MTILLNQKVTKKQIISELAETFIQHAKRRFSTTYLDYYIQGSTYVNFTDMIDIQLFESSDKKEISMIVDDTKSSRNTQKMVRRSWPIRINLLQTEDKHGYETHFSSIPIFGNSNIPSALTWSLFAIISSCKE